MKKTVHDFLRPRKKFPHVWCPGCGDGIILAAIARAIGSLGLEKNKITLVSGIGCSSRAPVYLDFCSLHTTHGRALPFATGIKHASPDLNVIVISGDGDGLAIGGNHFIHACRRNMDITLIVFNNNIYGMTGGQISPTMKKGAIGATAPYGNIDRPFDVCSLASASGASYVARGIVSKPNQLEKYIKQGIAKKGFSVIDAATHCNTVYSFYNKSGNAVKMMREMESRCMTIKQAEGKPEDELQSKILLGVFADRDGIEYTDAYSELIQQAERSVSDEELL